MQPTDLTAAPIGRTLRTIADWLLGGAARLMRTGNPAATIDRLFDSQHVEDLRVIIAGALLSLGASVVICLVYAFGSTSFHSDGVIFGTVTALAVFVACMTPVAAVIGGILAWVYRMGSARLGVVDLFACEISTLCRIVIVMDSVRREVELFSRDPPAEAAGGAKPAATVAGFTSQENYFPVFENNNRDLQGLEARVVINITAFYTYMKVLRDLMRSLAALPPGQGGPGPANESPRQRTIRDLIYILFLGLESARNAIGDLVEFQPEQAERTMVILIGELAAYRFLVDEFARKNDLRWRRLALRWEGYASLVPALWAKVPVEMENAKARLAEAKAHAHLIGPGIHEARKVEHQEWKAANELVQALKDGYEAAKEAAMRNAPAAQQPASPA